MGARLSWTDNKHWGGEINTPFFSQQPLPGIGMRHMDDRKNGIALLENPGMLTCAEIVEKTSGSQKHAAPVGPLAESKDLIAEQQPPIEKEPPAVLQLGAMPIRPAPPPIESMTPEHVSRSTARAPGAASRASAAQQRAERARNLAAMFLFFWRKSD